MSENENGSLPSVGDKKKHNWLLTGAFSILSAFGGAALESATKIVQEQITPMMKDGLCYGQTKLTKNPNDSKPTVIFFELIGDKEDKIRNAIADAISRQYEFNVIKLCSDAKPSPYGEWKENVLEARAYLTKIADRMKADYIVMGDVSGNKPRLIYADPSLINYVFDNNVQGGFGNEFDIANPASVVDSIDFQNAIIDGMRSLSEKSGCISPAYRACVIDETKSFYLMASQKLGKIQELVVDKKLFLSNGAYKSFYNQASLALAQIRILLQQKYGIDNQDRTDHKSKGENILDSAHMALVFSHSALKGYDNNDYSFEEKFDRAALSLAKAEHCADSNDAKAAMEDYEDVLSSLDKMKYDHNKIKGALARIDFAKAKIIYLATTKSQSDQAFRLLASQTAEKIKKGQLQLVEDARSIGFYNYENILRALVIDADFVQKAIESVGEDQRFATLPKVKSSACH